jgi:hypothetical protein
MLDVLERAIRQRDVRQHEEAVNCGPNPLQGFA